ncbi:MAG: hypothetical protein FuNoV1_gp3 [Hangzhou nora-like virus 1]|nr:MAG: hypothetical protein FuNoV1_gp3 [Hangzhou nora-like virus 1]
MQAKDTQIIVRDNPRVFRNFLSTLPSPQTIKTAIEEGNVITETSVTSINTKVLALERPFTAFSLRAPRKVRLPDHVFGALELGNAFSALIPIPFLLPAVGTNIILNPLITTHQASLISMYRYCQAHAYWFIYVPCPLGTAYILRATAPEFDSSTKTRGVRWKPAAFNTMAVYLPWNSDISVVPTGIGRPGSSGLSLKIETVENNTSTTVQENLSAIAYCLVTNIRLNGMSTTDGFGDMEGVSLPGFNFHPIKESEEYLQEEELKKVKYELHSDSKATTEVEAEGANNLAVDNKVDETPSRTLMPTTERPQNQPRPPRKGTGKGKRDQTGLVNTVWFELGNVTLTDEDIGKPIEYIIDPLSLNKRGESISLPFQRNVWCSGSRQAGYVRTLIVKLAIARPPTISGIVEVRDSTNVSSRYLVEYGGSIEFPVIPSYFACPRNAIPRDSNNAWMRTYQMKCSFVYTIQAVNRSVDQKDVTMTAFVRIGDTVFQAPTKPQQPVKYNLDIYKYLTGICEEYEVEKEEELRKVSLKLHSDQSMIQAGWDDSFENTIDETETVGECDSISPDEQPEYSKRYVDAIAPEASEENEQGESNLGGAYEEELDQDNFQVECFNEEVKVGETIAIPLNLPVIIDLAGNSETNVITEKFERNAQIIPRGQGQFGPSVGTYTIAIRLPTTIAADVEHVQVPGDMVDEAVAYVFGLSSILSLATSALQGIGGPLISGAIQAGREILGNLGNGLGGKPSNSSAQESNPSAHPVSLMGGIDVSRFINFLKPVLDNEIQNPTFGSLLLKIRDVLSNQPTYTVSSIPVRVYARMDKSAVERTVFDRTATPKTQGIKNRIYIPPDAYSRIIYSFMSTDQTYIPGSKQNKHFVQFLKCAFSSDFKKVKTGVTLDQVLDTSVDPDDYRNIMINIRGTLTGSQL